MRNRVRTLATVGVFATAVALIAGLAGRGGDPGLEKLPVASAGGEAAADSAAGATAQRSTLLAPEFGGVEYRVKGELPALAGSAPAYRLGSDGSADAVARLAAALGLDGDVREEDRAWVVRDATRELRVERVAGLPWYLGTACPEVPVASDGTRVDAGGDVAVSCATAVASSGSGGGVDPGFVGGCEDGKECSVEPSAPTLVAPVPPDLAPPTIAPCPPGAECAGAATPDDAAGKPCDGVECASPVPAERPERPADLPTRAEAERLARDVFTRMGVDLDGFAVDDAWFTWEARVELRLDGLAVVGPGHWLGIGPKGEVVHGNGFLARPDRIGDYPLAGVETGLRRLNEGFLGGPRPLTAVDAREGATAVGSGAAPVPAPSGIVPPGAEPAVDLPAVDLPAVPCPPDAADTCAPVPEPAPEPEPAPVPEPAPEPVVLTVTGAHLVLLHIDDVLVPAYVFELADGGETHPVPAVTDEWLDQQAVPRKG